MRILLIGEFSRLHNSLKEGLLKLGHEVVLVSNGDGFKNYPSDFSTKAKWCESIWLTMLRKGIHKLTKFDIATIEFGIRFFLFLKDSKAFDCVQLINEAPIQTTRKFELFLLKKVFKKNKNVFLLCSGVDFSTLQHMLKKKERYSIMNPYFEGIPEAKNQFDFMFDYNSKSHVKIHNFLYENIKGVIASDLDYVNPLIENKKFLGIIPNPINIDLIKNIENPIAEKIVVFLGINKNTKHTKGIVFFEKALEIIQNKYSEKVEIIITENIPYQEYITLYNKAHIVLDQVYGYDQGYNALEAMAKGKVVFTGAEKEFVEYYNLTETVAINALPNTKQIVDELSFLIDNPTEILLLGKRARAFIEKEHDYIKIANKYLKVWNT